MRYESMSYFLGKPIKSKYIHKIQFLFAASKDVTDFSSWVDFDIFGFVCILEIRIPRFELAFRVIRKSLIITDMSVSSPN